MKRTNHPDLQDTLLSRAAEPSGTPVERRAGRDRRHAETGPPTKRERRTALEARKPQVIEVDLSPSEWAQFGDPSPPADTSEP